MTLTPSSESALTPITSAESLSVAGLRDLRAANCAPVGAPAITSAEVKGRAAGPRKILAE